MAHADQCLVKIWGFEHCRGRGLVGVVAEEFETCLGCSERMRDLMQSYFRKSSIFKEAMTKNLQDHLCKVIRPVAIIRQFDLEGWPRV